MVGGKNRYRDNDFGFEIAWNEEDSQWEILDGGNILFLARWMPEIIHPILISG